MKKVATGFVILFLVGLISSSCDELFGDLIQFDTDYYEFDFVLEPTDETGLLVFHDEVFESDIDKQLSDNGLNRDKLKSVKLIEATVEITTNGEYQDFSFVDFLEVTIKSDTIAALKIAWKETIPQGQNILELDITEDELKQFLLDQHFTITAKGFINTAITEEIDFLAKVRFHVKGGL